MKVTFFFEKDGQDVFAFFHYQHYYDRTHPQYKQMFMSYSHIGQHSACHIDYVKECEVADPESYKALADELEDLGYNLKVVSRHVRAPHAKPHTKEARKKISQAKKGVSNTRIIRPTKEVDGVTLYRCSGCGGFFDKSKFYPIKHSLLGISHKCTTCESAYRNKLNKAARARAKAAKQS